MAIADWYKLSPGEARAMGRLGRLKNAPPKFVMGRESDGHLIVVPASRFDKRRWDITKGGKITKGER